MQINPPNELLPFIRHYLFLDSETNAVKKLRLFSDGNTGMVFTNSGNLVSDIEDKKISNYPDSFVYGQISEFKDLYAAGRTSLIIVVFQPNGLNRLLGIHANEIKDIIIRTEELFGRQSIILHEELFHQHLNVKNKFQLLNTFFISLLPKQLFSNQTLIQESLNFILKNKGDISIQQLVKHTGYTERHIERTFAGCIGINPKKYGNIVKLHSFLNLLKDKSKRDNFTRLSYEAGYADQSHLIKEFRKYTGITPSQYLNHTRKLATNFMEF